MAVREYKFSEEKEQVSFQEFKSRFDHYPQEAVANIIEKLQRMLNLK